MKKSIILILSLITGVCYAQRQGDNYKKEEMRNHLSQFISPNESIQVWVEEIDVHESAKEMGLTTSTDLDIYMKVGVAFGHIEDSQTIHIEPGQTYNSKNMQDTTVAVSFDTILNKLLSYDGTDEVSEVQKAITDLNSQYTGLINLELWEDGIQRNTKIADLKLTSLIESPEKRYKKNCEIIEDLTILDTELALINPMTVFFDSDFSTVDSDFLRKNKGMEIGINHVKLCYQVTKH